MYRVMIVDDELYIRRSFCNRIDWAAYNMSVVGEASNGQEAYELVPQLQPDLMFVDIRMPVLDGFDLVSLLKEEYPDIAIIIISAYSDFQYARKAIERGVFDYLLKPLEEDEVDKTLKRLLIHLKEQEEQNKTINLYNIRDSGLADREFVCLCVYVKYGIEDEPHVQRLLQKYLPKEGNLYRVAGHSVSLCDIFCFCAWEINRREFAKELSVLLGTGDEFGRVVLGISEVHRGTMELCLDEFQRYMSEAVSAAKEKLFSPCRQVFVWEKKDKSQVSPYNTPKLALVYSALAKKDYHLAGKGLLSYLNDFDWDRIRDIITIEIIVSTVLELLFKAGWDSGIIDEVQIRTNTFRRANFVFLFDRPEEIYEHLRILAETLTEEMDSRNSSDLAQRIAHYIQENYGSSLQMEELERRFFMSSSSLLSAFKKKKNMTITAYIEAVRMEKARELLKSGLYSVQDTAEAVGYLDANYFCKVFKRYTGSTPSKYRMKK